MLDVILHCERNAFFVKVDTLYLDRNHVADRQHLRGVLNESVGYFGDMHKSVLMNADVHESAEVDDVSDSTRKLHTGCEVAHIHNVCAEHGEGETVTNVASRLFKLANDIVESRLAYFKLFANLFCSLEIDLET